VDRVVHPYNIWHLFIVDYVCRDDNFAVPNLFNQDISFDIKPFILDSAKDNIPELKLAINDYITPEQVGK